MHNNNKPIKITPLDTSNIVDKIPQRMCWSIKNSNLPNIWEITQGEATRAVVIDTGFPIHRDIEDNAIKGPCFAEGDDDPIDYQGHSTHVTGIICAKNNEYGAVGVAPKAKVTTIKALGNDGSGSFQSINKALDYAIKLKPDVVCMSLGAPTGHPEMHKKIKKLYKLNIPILVAAGNNGRDDGVEYPAIYPETIAVGAFDKYGRIADFSSKGSQLEWAAPGHEIYSTYLNNTYVKQSGTSMAAPWMCGVICLLKAKHKKQEKETGKNDCKTVEDVRKHLLKYTIDKGMIGRDDIYGYGIVDVESLIKGSSHPVETIKSVKKKQSVLHKLWDIVKIIFQ